MSPRQATHAVLPLREVEGAHILHALQVSNWNKRQAARALGISRDTLYRKIAEHGLAPERGLRPADGGTERLE